MSLVKANSIAKADGSQETSLDDLLSGRAKAWVNFNGTGTVAVRDSLNISSITDNAAGDYSENFSTAFGAATYASSGVSNRGSGGGTVNIFTGPYAGNPTASAFRNITASTGGTPTDMEYVSAAFHGDF